MAIRDAALAGLTRQQVLDLHYSMVLLRRFEEKAAEAATLGKIGGFLHLSIGQEATTVGAIGVLAPADYVVGTYRALGHAIAKGLEPRAVMAELFGKATGCCRGKGGAMHLYSDERRLIGGQAIVGAQLPVAVGIGFAIQYQGRDDIVLVPFGEGVVDEGAFHEGLNLAALWKLPVVFLCERNQPSAGKAGPGVRTVETLAPRAAAYGMPYLEVDGMDVLAVREAVSAAAERARAGGGPTLVESTLYRFRGHSVDDAARSRPRDEEEQWRATRDPIMLFERSLRERDLLTDAEQHANEEKAQQAVEDAARFAEESPEPAEDALYEHVTMGNAGAIAWRERDNENEHEENEEDRRFTKEI